MTVIVPLLALLQCVLPGVARGQVFVPFHFREAAANLLTNPVLDPYAKMAELKICAVRIEAVRVSAPV